jgi:hypothetical protein
VRHNIPIEGIERGIVNVGNEHALAQIVEYHDSHRTGQPAKGLRWLPRPVWGLSCDLASNLASAATKFLCAAHADGPARLEGGEEERRGVAISQIFLRLRQQTGKEIPLPPWTFQLYSGKERARSEDRSLY